MDSVQSASLEHVAGRIPNSSAPKPPGPLYESLKNAVPKALPPAQTNDLAQNKPHNQPQNSNETGGHAQESIVILVLGPAGSGKSSFIASVSGLEVDLESDMNGCIPRTFSNGKSRITLLDTPGFDDTIQTDLENLDSVVKQVKALGPITGVVYLHRVTDKRMTGSAHRNIKILRELCSQESFSRIVLATSMWNNLGERTFSDAAGREKELQEQFWKDLIAEGAQCRRFHGTRDSGQNVIESLLSAPRQLHLAIEREVDGMRLQDTGAGRVITSEARLMQGICQREEQKGEDHHMTPDHPLVVRDLALDMQSSVVPFRHLLQGFNNIVGRIMALLKGT